MSEARVVQQMRQHVAESVMMARTAGHADTIYLPDVLEVIDTLTQRAEAAEAECDGLKFAQQHIVAERDALRKDAARLDWMESERVLRASFYPLCFPPCWVVEASEVTSGETLRVAIDAAMAIQTTTGETHE